MQASETYKAFKEVKVDDEKGNLTGRRIGRGSEQFEGQKKCRDPKSGKKVFGTIMRAFSMLTLVGTPPPILWSLDGSWQGDFNRKSRMVVVKIRAVTDRTVGIRK